jgi:hypothetical protein
MKKIIVILAMLVTSTAYADACSTALGNTFVPAQEVALCKQFSTAVSLDQTFSGTAQARYPAASVITPAVTYAASLGNITARHSIIAAGAPTSAFVALPAITLSVGDQFSVFNQGSNPVAIVPSTGSLNGAAALTPFSCPAGKRCDCIGITTALWGCGNLG